MYPLSPVGTRSGNDLYPKVHITILGVSFDKDTSKCLIWLQRREVPSLALATPDLHSFLWLWLFFRPAVLSHSYHKQLCCFTSLRSMCNFNNLCIICSNLAKTIHYRQNTFQRVLSPLAEPGKMDLAITLTTAEGLQMLSLTCTRSMIRY